MKIGFFTDTYLPIIGGIPISVKSHKDSLEKLGHKVYIITSQGPKNYEEKDASIIRIKGIPIPFKGFEGHRFVLRFKKYLSLVKDLNLDTIHIHTEFPIGKLGIYASQKLNIPSVYTMHTMHEYFFNKSKNIGIKIFKLFFILANRKALKKFISKTHSTIVPTHKILTLLEKDYNIKGKYNVVPTGFNLEKFYSQNHSLEEIQALKVKFNLVNDFVCIYVGRLSPEKDISYLISAFASFCQNHPQSKFVIVGDGPEKKALQKQVKQLQIENNVCFLGFVPYDNLGIYYQLGNCFLSASLFETQGLTFVEAMASSLVLLARYDQALDGLIDNGNNAFFYHQKEELIHYLSLLYNDNKKTKTMSMNAKNSILNYDQTSFASKMISIYKEAIKNNKENNNQNNNQNNNHN
ncbi:glycosyltransferase ['Santalum album' aster yellows phytoplasma]|uniref:Glycosyltransferase n=1 Tax='Santalum album' aster yellows phytoplasma TaxID=2831467 RepID=A0ABS5LLK2_9MOLU|nr:glycosyltransferase ['Santalum album' aster yellows phytoplasma]MBS2993881.1 glycosyltransferase ['Santalum album' aster yellows phytoplasma]